MITPLEFSGPGWQQTREHWHAAVQKTRCVALADVQARPAWVPGAVTTGWQNLSALLDEIDYRKIPREVAIWRRTCGAITELRKQAEAADEEKLAATLDQLMTVAVLFAAQTLKDQTP